MTSGINASGRPNLEPLWTSYRFGGYPQSAMRSTPLSAGLPRACLSPRDLPSPNPIHPSEYDGSMHRQDRALVDSLDQRAKHVISTASLTPIEEHSPSPLVARLEKISILPPMNVGYGAAAPVSPGPSPRGDIHHYMHAPGRTSLPTSPARSPGYYTGSDASPPSSRRSSLLEARDQLRTWGHVYYGNAKTADAFIIARSLRRDGGASPKDAKGHDYRQGPPNTPTTPLPPKRLTVRAIVRPRDMERSSFLIQRSFDMDQLRATIPDPPRHHGSSPTSRRSSSVHSGALMRSRAGSMDHESFMRDAKTVPIHIKYARAYLPVIAVLLTSGHVHEGDVIYLPMPHAEAWPKTAQYVYTGQGELTSEVRENILYLAGKV